MAVNLMVDVPKTHPRYLSLLKREKIVDGLKAGIVVPQGLIAQGRGEAFDYLLGEKSIPPAIEAEKTAAAHLVLSSRPVISVNGNVASLARNEIIELSRAVPATIEINLFYRSEERARKIAAYFRRAGAKDVIGMRPNARLPGLDSKRALCSLNGIYSADVVLVPLEDGDRTQALIKMKRTVLAIDLNPMSRTSIAATVTVVDELTRALPKITKYVQRLRKNRASAVRMVQRYNNRENLKAVYGYLNTRLTRMSRH